MQQKPAQLNVAQNIIFARKQNRNSNTFNICIVLNTSDLSNLKI